MVKVNIGHAIRINGLLTIEYLRLTRLIEDSEHEIEKMVLIRRRDELPELIDIDENII